MPHVKSVEAAAAFEFGAGRHFFVVVERHVPCELSFFPLATRLPQVDDPGRNPADSRQFGITQVQIAAEYYDPVTTNRETMDVDVNRYSVGNESESPAWCDKLRPGVYCPQDHYRLGSGGDFMLSKQIFN